MTFRRSIDCRDHHGCGADEQGVQQKELTSRVRAENDRKRSRDQADGDDHRRGPHQTTPGACRGERRQQRRTLEHDGDERNPSAGEAGRQEQEGREQEQQHHAVPIARQARLQRALDGGLRQVGHHRSRRSLPRAHVITRPGPASPEPGEA